MQATNTAGYDAPIGLTADPVVFTLLDGRLCVLLARRLEEPQRGMFALPGGFVGASEAPEQTAERKLREKTGVGSVHLEQLRTYADPRATRAAGCPTIAYMALVRPETLPEEPPVDRDASWHPLDALPELALDHAVIVDDGLWRLHARVADKVWFVRKALALLTEPFTLRQAQQLYEALRGEEVDAANFRRDVRATGLLEDTGALRSEGPGRPGRFTGAPEAAKDSPRTPPRPHGVLCRRAHRRGLVSPSAPARPSASARSLSRPCPSTGARRRARRSHHPRDASDRRVVPRRVQRPRRPEARRRQRAVRWQFPHVDRGRRACDDRGRRRSPAPASRPPRPSTCDRQHQAAAERERVRTAIASGWVRPSAGRSAASDAAPASPRLALQRAADQHDAAVRQLHHAPSPSS